MPGGNQVTGYIREAEAVRTVMGLLAVEGVSGSEGAVARVITEAVAKAGIAGTRLRHDRAHARIPLPTEVGNLIVELPGRGKLARARPHLFCAHMDTVDLARGARPVRKGRIIKAGGATALGADDRTGCGVLVTLVRTLARLRCDHRPLVLLFTVREESGLWGSRHVDRRCLGKCDMGFSYDGGDPAELAVAAPSAVVMEIVVEGVASHAGVHPERGVSAAAIFAEAVWRLASDGWLGRIARGREKGTSNIGAVCGGEATNIVMPNLVAAGEARSYSRKFLDRIAGAFTTSFEAAAVRARNDAGRTGKVRIRLTPQYETFDLGDGAPVVLEAERAAASVGLAPKKVRLFGGLDANWLNAYGLPTVTLGAGAHNPHDVGEELRIDEYLLGCEIAVRLAVSK